jgi:predicted protein tyrosine phosphatase
MNNKILQDYLKTDLFEGIISRKEFLTLHNNNLISKDIAIISIHDPDIPLHNDEIMNKYNSSIQMQFWDIEEQIGNYKPITKEQGQILKDFIITNKDKKFLIHCMAGQSRSAGIACAIECIVKFDGDKYNYLTGGENASDVKNHSRYSPNLIVFDAIIN